MHDGAARAAPQAAAWNLEPRSGTLAPPMIAGLLRGATLVLQTRFYCALNRTGARGDVDALRREPLGEGLLLPPPAAPGGGGAGTARTTTFR